MPPHPGLPDLDLLANLAVVRQKREASWKSLFLLRLDGFDEAARCGSLTGLAPRRRLGDRKILFHQGGPDEDPVRLSRIHIAISDFAPAHRQAVKRDLFIRNDAPVLRAPVRIQVSGFAQVRRQLWNPRWVDACRGAREQLRSLYDFTRHDPLGLTGAGLGLLLGTSVR